MRKTIVGVLVLAGLVGALSSCISHPEPTSKSERMIDSARVFIAVVVKEDYAAAEKDFSDELKSKLPPAKLQEGWQTILMQVGAFKEQLDANTALTREDNVTYDVVVILCHFERGNLNVRVAFNAKNQIAGVYFLPA